MIVKRIKQKEKPKEKEREKRESRVVNCRRGYRANFGDSKVAAFERLRAL
jgi:hypothetical protein